MVAVPVVSHGVVEDAQLGLELHEQALGALLDDDEREQVLVRARGAEAHDELGRVEDAGAADRVEAITRDSRLTDLDISISSRTQT